MIEIIYNHDYFSNEYMTKYFESEEEFSAWLYREREKHIIVMKSARKIKK